MDDHRLTLREAARRLGVSVPTLRRRIRRGELSAVRVPGRYGEQLEVTLSDLEGMISVDHGHLSMADQADREADQAAYWKGRWAELRETVERLERLLAAGASTAAPEPEPGQEELRETLRARTQELAHARNLVDSLRRDKARLETEVQALRDQLRGASGEATAEAPAWGTFRKR